MPIITLPNGELRYVTDAQYAELLRQQQQAQAQTPIAQTSNPLGDAASLASSVSSIGSLFGGGGGSSVPDAPFPVGTSMDGGTLMSDGSVAGAGNFGVADIAGGLAGAYGMYDLWKNKKHGTEGALQGAVSGGLLGSATAGGLAALGTSVMPGLGTAIGAGLGLGLGYFGNLGDKDRYKDEYNRAQKLREQGIKWGWNNQEPTSGRSKEELVALENQKIQAGQYGNPTFAQSRNESDLKPEDIIGYAAFGEKFGSKWTDTTAEARRQIAQKLLESGAVREHHGTVDLSFTPELEKYAQEILGKPPSDPQTQQASQQQSATEGQSGGQQGGGRERRRPPRFPSGPSLPGTSPSPGVQPYTRAAYGTDGNPLSFEAMLQTMNRRRAYA